MRNLLRKVIFVVVGVAMLGASAAVMVVAGALAALYGVLKPYLGGPGARRRSSCWLPRAS